MFYRFRHKMRLSGNRFTSSIANALVKQGSNHEHYCFGKVPLLITCEHATNHLPDGFSWSPHDSQHIKDTHWAYDPGARDFALELAQNLSASCLLTKYSRLLVDCNRHPAALTLCRQSGDGVEVEFNRGVEVGGEEHMRRIKNWYLDYHLALGSADAMSFEGIFSIHTFNPTYEGVKREFEIGVLTTSQDELVTEIAEGLIDHGFSARINRPWSGKDGFMYAADSLRIAFGFKRPAIMFEFRNDVCQDPEWRANVLKALLQQFSQVGIVNLEDPSFDSALLNIC